MSDAWVLIGIFIWYSMLLSFHLTVIFHFIQQCDSINELLDSIRSHLAKAAGYTGSICILRLKGFSIINIIIVVLKSTCPNKLDYYLTAIFV